MPLPTCLGGQVSGPQEPRCNTKTDTTTNNMPPLKVLSLPFLLSCWATSCTDCGCSMLESTVRGWQPLGPSCDHMRSPTCLAPSGSS